MNNDSKKELKNPQKSEKIKKMFDKISHQYDFYNDIISFFTHFLVKKRSLDLLDDIFEKKIKDGKIKENELKFLDLCCGSGDLARILYKKYPNSKIIGVDFSDKMLEIAKNKNDKISYFKQDAQDLEFKDNSFDCVVMGFGLRNVENKKRCLDEIYRILKPEGVFLHLDFGKKNIISKIYDKIVLFLVNFLKKDIEEKSAYKYLINSKNEFDEPEKLIEKFKIAGFKTGGYKNTDFKTMDFKKTVVKYFLFKIISAQIVEK